MDNTEVETGQARISIKDNRKKKWFWMDNQVFNGHAAKMKPSGVAVYCALLRHANNATARTRLSMRTVADELGLSTTTVIKTLKRLEDMNLIKVERPGTPRCNVYTILEPPHVSKSDTYVLESDTYVSKNDTYVSKNDTELNITTKLISKHNNTGVVVSASPLSSKQESSYNALLKEGITKKTTLQLAKKHSLPRVLEVCAAADVKEGITDKPAWIVAALNKGWVVQIPASGENSKTEPYAGVREL